VHKNHLKQTFTQPQNIEGGYRYHPVKNTGKERFVTNHLQECCPGSVSIPLFIPVLSELNVYCFFTEVQGISPLAVQIWEFFTPLLPNGLPFPPATLTGTRALSLSLSHPSLDSHPLSSKSKPCIQGSE
jgi:hypothetical protein